MKLSATNTPSGKLAAKFEEEWEGVQYVCFDDDHVTLDGDFSEEELRLVLNRARQVWDLISKEDW